MSSVAPSAVGFIAAGDALPPRALVNDLTLVKALVGADDGPETMRHRTLQNRILPACHTAYRHLRDRAAERTKAPTGPEEAGAHWQDIDPEGERFIAMRPGFSRLDALQADALQEFWGGFDNAMDASAWFHSLHAATYGVFGADAADETTRDPHAVQMLLADTPEAQSWRERYAIVQLLPQFAQAAKQLRSGEVRSSTPSDDWRMG
jgi:hypothetical protein